MNKKVYATPAMNVVELEVSDIVCSSFSGVNSDYLGYGGASVNDTGTNSGPRGRGRGNSI